MEELENKYIDLLLRRCINFKISKSLFIAYYKDNREFVQKLILKAHELGIHDIGLDEVDIEEKHSILKKIDYNDIDKCAYFNKSKWDEYAIKDASFLVLETEYPKVMDDIDSKKIGKSGYIERTSRPIFRAKETSYSIPWCIAALPNKTWAKSLFPELSEEDAYIKLYKLIISMCKIDTVNPVESWSDEMSKQLIIIDKLNNLNITKMIYHNNLGTELELELMRNASWNSAASLGNDMIVNMPSYEIFTCPHMRKTNGIVFASIPLFINGGIVENFYLEFKDGKVVKYNAKSGKDLLETVLNTDTNANYLGEVALIDNDSPISNTNLVYGTTLFDENASCHLALGDGFPDCVEGTKGLSEKELIDLGVNVSKNHVDFMVGTPDLDITADTNEGKKLIFKQGRFNI